MTALTSSISTPSACASGKSIPVLSITHGLHQGVCLTLDKPAYIIGRGESADLLLGDAGIAERHMALRFANGMVAVEALGEGVLIRGKHAQEVLIPAGNGHRTRLPLSIRIGSARLVVTDTASPLDKSDSSRRITPSWQRKPQWVVALLLMFLCVGAFAFRSESTSPLDELNVNSHLVIAATKRSATVIEARLWLAQQLAAANLDRVNVSEVEGQLRVQGSYTSGQKAQWTHVQQAFDRRFGQQILLHSDMVPRADVAKPRVRFQAVWFGTNPYVINDSGKRLYPGAALADEWTLEHIENNQVILSRGEERFTFTL